MGEFVSDDVQPKGLGGRRKITTQLRQRPPRSATQKRGHRGDPGSPDDTRQRPSAPTLHGISATPGPVATPGRRTSGTRLHLPWSFGSRFNFQTQPLICRRRTTAGRQ